MERTETLELERDGPILRVWLARPEKRNALSGTVLREIEALFGDLQTDFETRVVILGGRGLAFSSGADRGDPPGSARMAAGSGVSDRERRHTAQLGQRACQAIEALEAVTLARLHGYVLGGGLALALACDFRFAAEGTILGLPEVDLGIPLTWGATPRLVHEVGAARARELLLLKERIEAGEAERIGLVHRVFASNALDAAVDEAALRLAEKPEIAVHMTKTQLRAYAQRSVLGDVREGDGDMLLEASRSGAGRDNFRPKER